MEVFRRRYLLKLLVERELASRYEGSALGFIWSYINPLSQFIVYWFIVGTVMGKADQVPNYAIHVFAALIVVHFFTETFGAGTRSIVRNKALMKKMALPREMFPVAAMLVSLVHVGPQLLILLGFALTVGWTFSFTAIAALLLSILLAMILGTALALMFSVANVFFRDFGSFVGIVTNYVRWCVPMIYPFAMVADNLPGWAQEIYLANPISIAVVAMQEAFWIPTVAEEHSHLAIMPDHLFERGMIAVVGCLILLGIAQMIFSKFEKKIPERL